MNNYEENFEVSLQELKNKINKFLKIYLSRSIVLIIIFLILKYHNIIDWSYFWIVSPLWILFAILIVIFLSIILFAQIISLFKSNE